MRGKSPISVVIDASVLLAFYLPAEPYKAQALALLRDATAGLVKLAVPTLTRYEVLNVLSSAVRGVKGNQRLSADDALEIMAAMSKLALEERDIKGLEGRILRLSQEHHRSAYDAAYLALAEHLGVDFLTGDERLCNAMKARWRRVKFVGDYKPFNSVI
ncbi:MAG: type II toxin-antitoxin system VapC family toxin [Candidatus Bipolaricaulota bacterium]|nr:type II toxin-antitoxin system VapC family toxin [Candidatus Bipolaricaulota bacterium]